MFIETNPNPVGRRVTDCAVRAVAIALGVDWETAYLMIALNGIQMGDMMEVNGVWGSVLRQHGFYRKSLPDMCPDCYTVEDFCRDHPEGVFVLGTHGHTVAVVDGDWLDIWDSGDEPVEYFWYRKEQ